MNEELAGRPCLPQILHNGVRRQHKIFAASGIALVLLSVAWIYSGLGLGVFRAHPYIGFETKYGTGNHQTQTANDDGSVIPRQIWQIMLPKNQDVDKVAVNPENLKDTASWLAMNTNYKYTLVGQKGGDQFVQDQFGNEPGIVEAYNSLPNVGMKSDLLRYLLLDIEGGVYTDTDTIALKPIDVWVPAGLRDKVRLVIGIEFDRRDGVAWADIPHWLQFCQWTIAAAPGHPVFPKMVARILESLQDLSATHGLPVNQLHFTSFEVMNSTGPAAWTDVVFEQLQEHDPTLNTTKDLSFMTGPKLYGDILVLPIDAFGMGQQHSNSTNDGTIPNDALVKHIFHGSWRGD